MSIDSLRVIVPHKKGAAGNYLDFEGIRIRPEALVYSDVFEGDTKRIEFTLQNISSKPALVKICPPNSCAFRLSASLKTCLVSPGLKITRSLTFSNLRHAYTRSMLEIFVNNQFLEYPIIIQTACALLVINKPELDFGTVDVGSSAMIRKMVLVNEGAVGTKFAIDLGTNELDLVVHPVRGAVRAHSEIKISIELVGIYEGEYFKEFWIKSSCRPIRIPLKVTVNVPHLIVFHPNTTGDFTLIDFEPTYCGSQSQESMVVHNVSAQTSTFVVLAEINNEVHPLMDVAELFPDFGMFSIAPSAGRMEPYEVRIFTLNFKPVFVSPKHAWKHQIHEELHRDFLVFVRILRVQCMDISEIVKSIERYKEMYDSNLYISASGMMSNFNKMLDDDSPHSITSESSGSSNTKNIDSTGPVVRFCLHGEAIKASLKLLPTAIDFGDIEVGFTEARMLRVANHSAVLSVQYRFNKVHCFEMSPAEGVLKPSEAVEVVVSATPTSIGVMQKTLLIHLLDPSESIFQTTTRQPIGHSTFDVKFNAPAVTMLRRPQFNLGISPKCTVHEVGKQTDEVTSLDPLCTPRAAVVSFHHLPAAPPPPPQQPPPFFTKPAMSTRRVSETRFKNQEKPKRCVSSKVDTLHNFHAISATQGVRKDVRRNRAPAIDRQPVAVSADSSESLVFPALPKGAWHREPHTQNYTFVLDQHPYKPRAGIARRITEPNIRLCRKDVGKKSETRVAFPNDRQRSNRPWPRDQPCKSIFTGSNRYSQPIDTVNTFATVERAEKKLHDEKYLNFTRKTALKIHEELAAILSKNQTDENPIYEVTNEHLYDLLRMKPPRSLLQPPIVKESKRLPEEVHVPLTPIQLYNIKINPHDINFGKVAPNSNSVEVLYMENFNKFDVKVQIMPGRTGVKLPKGDMRILKGCSNTSLPIVYNAETLGRYNGYMDYVINDNHSFEVIVTAEVVAKTLMLDTTSIVFSPTTPEEAFHPSFTTVSISNPLQTFTKFTWEVPENSSFTPKPFTGFVPPLRSMLCEIMKTPNPNGPQNSDLILKAESGIYQVLVCTIMPRKCKVEMVTTKLNVGEIPLNLVTTVKAFLRNGNYEDMMFKVMNPEPMPGVHVHPMSGVIKARSFQALELRMKIEGMLEFEYDVHVLIQRSNKLTLEVRGTVGYPKVVITPDVLHLRRISADSFDCLRLSAQNSGTTTVEIQFNLDEFPEYRLSPSRKKEIPFYGPEGFTLAPGKAQKFYLHFYPVDVATYNFYLPIVINGILGPPKIDNVDTYKSAFYLKPNVKLLQDYGTIIDDVPKKIPTVRIDCTVAGHLLTFSKLEFTFKMVPGSNTNHTEETVVISNEHRNPIEFLVSTVELCNTLCAFRLSHHAGKQVEEKPGLMMIVVNLDPGEFVVFRASFTPRVTGTFSTNVPIYVKKYGLGNAFNFLSLKGTYPSPTITSLTAEVCFYPVPLEVEVSRVIKLDCWNYSLLTEIQALVHVPESTTAQNLSASIKIHFLNGNVVSGNESHVYLPVQITFKSSRAVSFRGTVTFRDTGRGRATVAFTVTADNSTVTTHAYLSGSYGVQAEKPITSFTRAIKSNALKHSSSVNMRPASVQHHLNVGQYEKAGMTPKQASISSDEYLLLNEYASRFNTSSETTHKSIDHGSTTDARLDKDYSTSMNIYPQFPDAGDTSEYARHMRQTLEAAETWLYEQGYRCDFAASIPEGLTAMVDAVLNAHTSTRDTLEKFQMRNILDLLSNLAGPQVMKSFFKPCPPESNLHRVKQAHAMYRQLLQFLKAQGASLAHVRPKHLLSYADYIIYMRKVRPHFGLTAMVATDFSAPTPSGGEPDLLDPVTGGSVSIHEILRNAKESIDVINPPHFDVRHKTDPDCPLCVELLPQDKFYGLCKQAWLDVILQIFKTLIISKITLERVKDNFSSFSEVPSTELLGPADPASARYQLGIKEASQSNYQKELQKTLTNSLGKNIHNDSELLLLEWLNTHFETQRSLLWSQPPQQTQQATPSKKGEFTVRKTTHMGQPHSSVEGLCFAPAARRVANFDTDLADGLVLAAVTAAHCPYLVPLFFKDQLYLQPDSPEQAYHNAALLTNAWHAVRIGFSIKPTDIVVPNTLLLLMLTTALYNILPCLYPKTTVRFQTGLTSEISRQIQLTNTSPRRIGYTLHIIGDPQGYFSVDVPSSTNIVHIQSHEKSTISIKFKAKRIGKVTATLVLSGATISPQFAQHLAFTLEGEPIRLTTSETFTLSVPLYTPTSIALPIKPPNSGAAEYEIACTEVEPTNSNNLNATPWRELRQRKVPRRLYIHKSRLIKTHGDDRAHLSITVACLAPTTRHFWIIFTNPELGDFIIKISIMPRTTETMKTIQARLPDDWTNAECFCAAVWGTRELGMETCPCRSVIHIPCRSEMLWHAVKTMFEKTLEETERAFWSGHLETNIGLRLIKWLLGENKDSVSNEFSHIFCTSVAYNVQCSSPKYIRVPEKLTIPDIRLISSIEMPIHVLSTTPFPFNVGLTLTSVDKMEIRNYTVIFTEPSDSPIIMQLID